jgi:hypothetical protein
MVITTMTRTTKAPIRIARIRNTVAFDPRNAVTLAQSVTD